MYGDFYCRDLVCVGVGGAERGREERKGEERSGKGKRGAESDEGSLGEVYVEVEVGMEEGRESRFEDVVDL